MLKVNSYSILFLTALFLHNPNVLCFSSLQSNDAAHHSTQSQQSLLRNIVSQVENNDSTAPLFPISSVAPQPYNWHFNSSVDTFIPPLTLAGWDPNNSTNIFNTNHFTLPITDEISDASTNTNNNFNSSTVRNSQPQKVAHTNATEVQVPSEKEKGKNNQKKKPARQAKKKKSTKTYTCPTCSKELTSDRDSNIT